MNVEIILAVIFHHETRPPERHPTICLHEQLLTVARKQCHLGIVFQHDLRWTEYTNFIPLLTHTMYTLGRFQLPGYVFACRTTPPLATQNCQGMSSPIALHPRWPRKTARVCLRLPLYTAVGHAKLPGYVFAYRSTPPLATHTFSVDLAFLNFIVVEISSTSYLHIPYITVMSIPAFCI